MNQAGEAKAKAIPEAALRNNGHEPALCELPTGNLEELFTAHGVGHAVEL